MSADTPIEIDVELDRLFAQRSGADRLRMASAMFDAARTIAIEAIRAEQADISDVGLRAALFDRLYGDDFDAGERAWIRKQLMDRYESTAR